MTKKKRAKKDVGPDGQTAASPLPPGVKLLRTLEGHQNVVLSVAFDPQGRMLASGSSDNTVNLWDVRSGKLLRTLEGHHDGIVSVAFDMQGGTLASGSADKTVKLWEAKSGKLLRTLEGHWDWVVHVAFDPQGGTLASASSDKTVKLWEAQSGDLLRTLEGHRYAVNSVAFDTQGETLASGSPDQTVKLWEARSGKLLRTLEGQLGSVYSVAFDPQGETLASGSVDNTVKLWEGRSGKLLRTLEGHTGAVEVVALSPDGCLLASKSGDHTIRLWNCETWETVAVIPETTRTGWWIPALAFHPTLPLLATAGSEPDTPNEERSRLIHLWELDYDVLLGKPAGVAAAPRAVHHTTGKIVLVGDHSVGKTALGYRMIHGEFKEQKSTHGQQFWVFPELGNRRADGTECEAILWDFAGQPDYRLVHALFVDDADLALVLFDAADLRDPLHGVEFWLKQLNLGQDANGVPGVERSEPPADGQTGGSLRSTPGTRRCPIILVAAQTDRGSCSMTREELSAFCQRHRIVGPIVTSAFTGEGVAELIDRMKSMIPWEDKPATVTTMTFKRIKDYVLGLKETESDGQTIVTPDELRARLEKAFPFEQSEPTALAAGVNAEATEPAASAVGSHGGEGEKWSFTDAEMLTAVGHLENYGYVKRLRTSKGEERILLEPQRLNNLASSFVLKARRNPKGLGALEEKRLLAGGYGFPELKDLSEAEGDVLLDAAALLFLEHNVCFRETDPLRVEPYLVFPELINLKKPPEDEKATEDGVAYTVSGPTENVFASLVVLLGYTHTFTRTNQWHNNARYEVGDGLVCGFRQESERDGELDFVLCFRPDVGPPVRTLFQGLFESFLARRNLTVMRYEPVRCSKGHRLNRTVVRDAMRQGDDSAFCSKCGEKLTLPKMAEPIQLTRKVAAEVELQRRTAEQRTRFEQAVFRVQAYVGEQKIKPPECFISYAWGVPAGERWVEKRLATDLQKAGIQIVLDRKDNQFGDSLSRFISRIPYCDNVIVVGTPLYFQKFENRLDSTGSVVAAEVDLISQRLIGTQEEKRAVKTLLLAGEKKTSLPPLMWDGIHADFRNEAAYFITAFDLILSLYQFPKDHPAVADLRESLRGMEMR